MGFDFDKIADDAIGGQTTTAAPKTTTWAPGVQPEYDTGPAEDPSAAPVTPAVVTDDPLDIVAAQNHFVSFTGKLPEMARKASEIQITDDASRQTASEMVLQCKQTLKLAERALSGHDGYTRARDFKLSVDKFFREKIRQPLDQIIKQSLAPKLTAYQREQAELERRIRAKQEAEEAERRRRAMHQERCERVSQGYVDLFFALERQIYMNRQAAAAGLDESQRIKVDMPDAPAPAPVMAPDAPAPAPVMAPDAPAPAPVMAQQTKVQTDAGSVDMKKDWKITVVDFAKVPDDFKVLDEKAVRLALDNGADPGGIPGLKIEEDYKMATRTKAVR